MRVRVRMWLLLLLLPLTVLAVLVAVGEWFEWPFLRTPLQQALSRATDRNVFISEPFGVRLLGSMRLRAGTLVIGPPQDGSPTPIDTQGQPRDLLRATEARLVVPYATLWRLARGRAQALAITELNVDQLELNLLRDAQGRHNWRLAAADAAKPTTVSNLAFAAVPTVGRLGVRRGEVRLNDAALQLHIEAQVQTQEGWAASPAANAPNAPNAAAGASAAVPAAAARSASSAASPLARVAVGRTGLEVQVKGSYRRLPLTAQLQSSGLLPLVRSDGVDNTAAAVPFKIDLRLGRAHLLLDGNGTDLLHLGALDARFELSGPSLAAVGDALGITLPTTAAFTMRGSAQKSAAVWRAAVQTLNIGSSRLSGNFHYDTTPELPLLTGSLTGTTLALMDLGPAFGAGTPEVPAARRAGRVLPQREFDIPSLRAMDANVALKLDRVDLGTPLLEPVAPLSGRVQLRQGVLSMQDLVARTSDGELRGTLGVDARTPTPQWNADLRWSGIQLDRFFKARNPRNRAQTGKTAANAATDGVSHPRAQASAATPQNGYISGALGGTAKVRGVGRSTAAVLGSMDGQARLWLRQGSVSHLVVEAAGIDVAESLGLLIAGDKPLPVRCAVAQLNLKDGRAVPEVALLDTGDTTLWVGGELSFVDESLSLVLTARPHDFSPFSLRAPVRLVGSFSAPTVRLDVPAMGLRLAGAAVLGAIAPVLALLPLIDLGEEDRNVCQTTLARVRPNVGPKAKPGVR